MRAGDFPPDGDTPPAAPSDAGRKAPGMRASAFEAPAPDPAAERRWLIAMSMAAAAGVIAVLFIVAAPASERPLALRATGEGALIGVLATAPLAAALWAFARSNLAAVVAFRDTQLDFFESLRLRFSWPLIAAMSATAGVWEELVFRGMLQGAIDRAAPLPVAILAVNVVFGVLHWQSAMYALVAGLVGVYLSLVVIVSGDLLAAIIAHGLYDVVALAFVRRALIDRRRVQER